MGGLVGVWSDVDMSTDYAVLADACAGYPDPATAYAALSAATVQQAKPLDDRMANERTIFGLIGMSAGEAFMAALDADQALPARVKSWFKPSEAGIDMLSADAQGMIASMVSAGVISAAQGDTLAGYAKKESPEWPGLTRAQVKKAIDMRNGGLV